MDFAKYDDSMALRDKAGKVATAKAQGYGFISELVYDWFYVERKGSKAIADLFNVSFQSIYRWLSIWHFDPPDGVHMVDYSPATAFTGESKWEPISLAVVRALWRGVILQAVLDLKAEPNLEDPEVEEKRARATAWVADKKDIVCPSFIWVTEALNLDPGAVRKALIGC